MRYRRRRGVRRRGAAPRSPRDRECRGHRRHGEQRAEKSRTGRAVALEGAAAPNATAVGLQAAFLALGGSTGARKCSRASRGGCTSCSGPFEIDWEGENLERVNRTILKKYNAEIHPQLAIEGMIGLMAEGGFPAAGIERIRIDIFDVAHLIIGGGAEGDKTVVRTKEEADHSLRISFRWPPSTGEATPAQYTPERIAWDDVNGCCSGLRWSRTRASRAASRRSTPSADRDAHGWRVLVRQMSEYEGFTRGHVVGRRREEVLRRGGRARAPSAPGLRREGGEEPGEDLRPEPGHAPGVETGGTRMNEDDKNTLCRRIVETVGDAVIFADRDGIVRLWNPAAGRDFRLHGRGGYRAIAGPDHPQR